MSHEYLFNKITLKDGRVVKGIIDYITTKQIYFFDYTNNKNVDYVLLSILWKGNHDNMRFSVFCAIEFPELELPNVILIPQSNISSMTGSLPNYEKHKQRKRIIKTKSL
jgi:hypothetical protein